MDQIAQLQDRLQGKGIEKDIYDIWDAFMVEYGWIPYDEFLSLEAEIVTRLGDIIEKRNKSQNKRLSGKGVRN